MCFRVSFSIFRFIFDGSQLQDQKTNEAEILSLLTGLAPPSRAYYAPHARARPRSSISPVSVLHSAIKSPRSQMAIALHEGSVYGQLISASKIMRRPSQRDSRISRHLRDSERQRVLVEGIFGVRRKNGIQGCTPVETIA